MKYKLHLAVLALTMAFSSGLKAQIQFSKEYGGQYNEDGRWMEQLPDSGFIMTGGTVTYSNGQSDIWLVRADAYGNQLWAKSIGGVDFDFANMVKPTFDHGFVIAGLTNTYGAGGNDGWVVKTDANGITQWSTTVGDTGLQELEAIVQTADSGYIATGITYTAGTAYYDILLVKLNSAGAIQWQKNIGGGSYEIGNSIQQTGDGGYIIGGQTYSYGSLDGDYYLVKTDAAGNVQFQKTYSYTGIQEAHYVQVDRDGGYVLVGDADDLVDGFGDTDVLLLKTNSAGDSLWSKNYGGNKKDGGKTVEPTPDGGYILAGVTRSFNLINPNFYLVKTDSTGIIEWSNSSYGSAYHDHAYRAIQTSDGGYAEFGYFRNSAGAQNFSLVKLGPDGGVTKDIAIDEIDYPSRNICRSNLVPFKVTLTNYGATNETNIVVNMIITHGANTTTLRDTLLGSLAPGVTSSLQFDQTYDFNVDGAYSLMAYITHRSSDISYSNDTSLLALTVLPPTADPVTTSAVSCSASSLTLSSAAAATDSMFWYDAATNGNLVSTGNNFVTPVLNNTDTYYVQSVKGAGSKVGPADNTIGNGSYSNNGYLKFDSRIPFKLVSVKVYASAAGNRTIELRTSSGSVLQSKTVNVPVGSSRVYLNFDVPQGNDFQLGLGSGSGNLFRNSAGAVYPYDVSQTVEIYGSNSNSAGVYYYFYDWYIFVPYDNCGSNRVPVQGVIGSDPTTAFDGERCGPGTVVLTANSSGALSWYANATGGSSLATGSTFTTPSLSSSDVYYLQVGSCPDRIAVNASINSQAAQPAAPDVAHCGPGQVTLSATSPDQLNWYDASTNGVLLATGGTYTTPFLNVTTTYYVSAGAFCPSARVAVQAIINSAAAPVVNDVTACGPAAVTLSASAVDPVEWYDVPSGGTALATTYNFITPVLNGPATYYAQAVSTCPSQRIAVNANVIVVDSPVGTDASRCGSGSVVLSAQSLDAVTWWDALTGGTQLSSGLIYTTPSLNATTTFYAQASDNGCASIRVPVTAIISVTTPPVVPDVANCGPGTVTLVATSADTVYWYDSPAGGTLLATGSSFTTPSLSATTTYYAQASLSCPSARTMADAIITSSAPDPVVADTIACGAGAVTISAVSAFPVTWYDAPGGNILATGNTYTTPSLAVSSTTTYYAVAGASGCISNPVGLTITVNAKPADPVATGGVNCGPGSITLNASAADPVSWYAQPAGGTALATGNSYSAGYNATTTVYAESNNGTCSSNRVPVIATVNQLPVVNLGPNVINIQSGQTVTLDAGPGFTSYLWNTTAITQTITVGGAGLYYVTVTDNNNCVGSDSTTVNVLIGIDRIDAKNALLIYPNPSSGSFTVSVSGMNSAFSLKITDALGKIVAAEEHSSKGIYSGTFDLSQHPSGVYFIMLITESGTISRPVIIQ